MGFEDNWRRKQELRLRPVADRVYQGIFGEDIKIERFERQDDWILDKYFAMDVRITFTNGLILTGQEKFLSHKYSSFASVTVEEYQDPTIKEPGDWFKLAVQFYFVGYANKDETGFYPWVMINWPATVMATVKEELDWYSNGNQDGSARASFKYCYMNQIPSYCLIASDIKNGIKT